MKVSGHADPQAGQAGTGPVRTSRPVAGRAGRYEGRGPPGAGVARVGSRDGGQHERGILDAARERTHMVERPRQRRAAVQAGPPESGLEAHHSAQRRRDADRTPRVRAQRRVHHAARHRRRRPAARSARVAGGVAGVGGGAVVGVGRPRPVREFRQPRLAHDDSPRRPQALHRGRVVVGDMIGKDLRSGGGDRALHGQQILDRDRNPVQRTAPSPARHFILRAMRRRQRLLRQHQLKGIGPAVVLLDAGQRLLGKLYRRNRAGAHQRRQLGDGRGPGRGLRSRASSGRRRGSDLGRASGQVRSRLPLPACPRSGE